jgi:hypothetical protein
VLTSKHDDGATDLLDSEDLLVPMGRWAWKP